MNPKVKPIEELTKYARDAYDYKIIAFLKLKKPGRYYFMITSDPSAFLLLDTQNKNDYVSVLHFSDTV